MRKHSCTPKLALTSLYVHVPVCFLKVRETPPSDFALPAIACKAASSVENPTKFHIRTLIIPANPGVHHAVVTRSSSQGTQTGTAAGPETGGQVQDRRADRQRSVR